MIGRSVLRETVFPSEGGVWALTETIALGSFRILANLKPNRKLPLQALDLGTRA